MLRLKFQGSPISSEDLEQERIFLQFNNSIGLFKDNDTNGQLPPAIMKIIGYCHNNGHLPIDMQVKSLESSEKFKLIVEYWIIALDVSPERTYTIRFRNKKQIIIKNNTSQPAAAAVDII